jgi:anti-anti-sigma regulatory factor
MALPLFKVEGETLALYRNPETSELDQVKQALYDLAGASQSQGAALDMSALNGISSTTVGMTVAVHLRFAEAGKKLRIRLNPKLLKLFELTMLTDTLSLEMVGKDAGPKSAAARPARE